MKRLKIISAVSALIATSVFAQDGDKELNYGGLSAKIKVMHVINDKNNGYAPNDGSGYLVGVNYISPDILTDNLKVGLSVFANGDTGLTNWNEAGKKNARGMFVAKEGDHTALLGQAFLSYKYKDYALKFGRQTLDTPLTNAKASLLPNFYEAYSISGKVLEGLELNLMQITRMSYGSRAATDWGLIGESTGTAGAPLVLEEKNGIGQADFIPFEDISGVNSAGISVLGAKYTAIKGLKISAWNFYAYNIVNNFYTELAYGLGVAKDIKLGFSLQYLNQQSLDKFVNPYTSKEADFSLVGAKVGLKGNGWNVYAAFNQSDDSDQMYNIYGADPAYTSSLFSRNQYRQDVTSYKLGGVYKVMKGLKIVGSYASYSKSKTNNKSGWIPVDDASEIDFCTIYKPYKPVDLRVCHASRVSEYDEFGGSERQMSHTRFIASYSY